MKSLSIEKIYRQRQSKCVCSQYFHSPFDRPPVNIDSVTNVCCICKFSPKFIYDL